MTTPDRWEPDPLLIPAYLAGPHPDAPLSVPDRAWVVAGLTLAGKKAQDISDRIGVCLRLVRAIRAEPMTQICIRYLIETKAFENELHLAHVEFGTLAQTLNETEAELARTKKQLSNLIQNRSPLSQTGTFRCGHEKVKHNTYRWTDAKGREKSCCRECHADRERTRRANKSCQPVPTAASLQE